MTFPELNEPTSPSSDWNGDETSKWKRKVGMMMILVIALGIAFRRKLMVGWRQAMGWTRIYAHD